MQNAVTQRRGKWWIDNGEGLTLIGIVASTFFLFVALWLWFILAWAVPLTQNITTTHQLTFVPANYQIVDKVTNVFSENRGVGGAGGVGAPEVEMTLSKYQAVTDGRIHYLVFEPDVRIASSRLNYFFIHDGVVLNARQKFESPWYSWTGYYGGRSMNIDGNTMTVTRAFQYDGGFVGVCVLGISLTIIVWVDIWGITLGFVTEEFRKLRYRFYREW